MRHLLCFILILSFINEIYGQQKFAGKFYGDQSGISSAADFKVAAGKLSGTIIINGKKGTVAGVVNDTATSGTVYDVETGATHQYKSFVSGADLHFIITFKELNNLDVDLVMQKQTSAPTVNSNNKNKDSRLVGLWRYTDIITSGSGGNFGSFSTDYFMEFKADGAVLSWTGSSAGGAGDVSVSGTGSSRVDKGQWYTDGKNLILADPLTNQKATIFYYVEANRMMLHNGGSNKRVWERVR